MIVPARTPRGHSQTRADERLAAELLTARALLPKMLLDDVLGRDARVVVAGLEEDVEALHALHPAQRRRRARAGGRGPCGARPSRWAGGTRSTKGCRPTGRGRRCRGLPPPRSAASAPRRPGGGKASPRWLDSTGVQSAGADEPGCGRRTRGRSLGCRQGSLAGGLRPPPGSPTTSRRRISRTSQRRRGGPGSSTRRSSAASAPSPPGSRRARSAARRWSRSSSPRTTSARRRSRPSAGWFAKAERLLENEPESVEHGHLAAARALEAMVEGRATTTRSRRRERARDLATRFGDRDLQAIALVTLGRTPPPERKPGRGRAPARRGERCGALGRAPSLLHGHRLLRDDHLLQRRRRPAPGGRVDEGRRSAGARAGREVASQARAASTTPRCCA